MNPLTHAVFSQPGTYLAVKSKSSRLTYGDLLKEVTQLSDQIRAVLPDRYNKTGRPCCVLHLPNSVAFVESLLSMVMLDCPFTSVPLDTPLARLEFIIKDVGASLLITTKSLADSGRFNNLPSRELFTLTSAGTAREEDLVALLVGEECHAPSVILSPECCYIMYTSGSTGNPKGVQCIKSSLMNMAEGQIKSFGLTKNDVTAQFASIGFDAIISEIFATFLSGGSLAVLDPSDRLGMDLPAAMEALGATVITLPPSLLATYNRSEFPSLKKVIVAGEACTRRIADLWVKEGDIEFYNAYGAAETTVCALVYEHSKGRGDECQHVEASDGVRQQDTDGLPLGKAIQNVTVSVRDSDLYTLDFGEVGEICVSGRGLALGYIGHASGLTAERFATNPHDPSQTLYRTGDRGVMLGSGDVMFKGRVDEQKKIRGQMVNLQGIEETILQCEGVSHASVVIHRAGEGSSSLAAFVSPKWMSRSFLMDYLQKHLQCYEVPCHLIMKDVSELPRSASGKIDKKALCEDESLFVVSREQLPDREHHLTKTQYQVAKAWCEIIKSSEDLVTQLTSQTTYIEVGIASDLIGSLQKLINKTFGIKLKASQIMKSLTLEAQADLIDRALS